MLASRLPLYSIYVLMTHWVVSQDVSAKPDKKQDECSNRNWDDRIVVGMLFVGHGSLLMQIVDWNCKALTTIKIRLTSSHYIHNNHTIGKIFLPHKRYGIPKNIFRLKPCPFLCPITAFNLKMTASVNK